MHLKTLGLKNFRCYEEVEIDFHPEYTVLVGDNGTGKSTVLDAVAIALGGYLAGFDGVASNKIAQEDAHLKMYELGSRIDAEAQYPVEVSAVCSVRELPKTERTGISREKVLEWERSLHGKEGRTHITGAKSIMNYGQALQDGVRRGEKDVILPIIAYYGTGRLYMQKRKQKNTLSDIRFSRTNGYLTCLEPASNDKMMMKWFEQMTAIQLQEGVCVPELEAVKRAMGKCYSGARNQSRIARFEYKMKTHEMEITCENENGREKLPMKMLSDGLRSTISMVADIAYRMAVLNPQLLERVLEETPGIVLIDEVDMHLHPAWQKRIMEDLHYIFPKVQFIVTTHAPSVLVNVKREHIRLLENHQVYMPENTTYGREVEAILREMMKVEVRPEEVITVKDAFYRLLTEENYLAAKEKLTHLTELLGDNDGDVVQAKISYELENL